MGFVDMMTEADVYVTDELNWLNRIEYYEVSHMRELLKHLDSKPIETEEVTEEEKEWYSKKNPNDPFTKQSETETRTKGKPSGTKRRNPFPTYKYSSRLQGDLYESVIVDGTAVFLIYKNNTITIEDRIAEESRTLRSIEEQEYPYEPYRFKNGQELMDYVRRALSETPDSLFTKVRFLVSLYNDQEHYKRNIISADICWSYFQDRFSTTHYNLLTGGNGSGKSSLGNTIGALAYRPVSMTDPTAC